jgi:transcription elongation GreA/GreB family factor
VGDGEPQTVTIFNPDIPTSTSIQADTALGKALMGRRVGDEVEVEMHPALPKRRVTIEAIE